MKNNGNINNAIFLVAIINPSIGEGISAHPRVG